MRQKNGFTFIELVIVIAVIGVLSSIILASINGSRIRSKDNKRIVDLNNVSLAMDLYFDKYGAYPPSSQRCCDNNDFKENFESMVGVLVSEGYLPAVPQPPTTDYPYMHYQYPAGEAQGSLINTVLEGINPTTIGPHNSCRPFNTADWCSNTDPSTYFCLCHPY